MSSMYSSHKKKKIFLLGTLVHTGIPALRKSQQGRRDGSAIKITAALPGDPGSTPSIVVAAHSHLQLQFRRYNSSSRDSTPSSGFHGRQACTWYTDVRAHKISIHIK